jgi:hypothetical protein
MALYTTCPVQRDSAGAATFLSPDARKRANDVGGAVAPSGEVDSAAPFCDLRPVHSLALVATNEFLPRGTRMYFGGELPDELARDPRIEAEFVGTQNIAVG